MSTAGPDGGHHTSVPLLDVDHVGMTYGRGGLLHRRTVRAVDGVSLRLEAGTPEILAIIGESGSGKTTLARMILNLAKPTDGVIHFLGTDVTRIRTNRERMAFMRQVQPIFQNPFEAFNPLKRIDRYLFVSAKRFAGARGRRHRGQGRPDAASGRAVAGRSQRPLPA